jgi:hypothetical protein
MILCIEITLQMIQNLNNLSDKVQFLIHLYSSLCSIRVLAPRGYKLVCVFKITLCVLVILFFKMRLQIIKKTSMN